jgi:putative DNA primase/helicase
LFKGYIPTNGKKPTEEYKNRIDFYKLEDVEKLNSYGGVLKDEIIQIDVDDYEKSEIVFKIVCDLNINCNVLETTRGKHFYFLNTNVDRRKQGYSTPIGVKVDIGLGLQNAVIPIKLDGKLRKWLKEVDKLDYLPSWLEPIDKRDIDFTKMGEGEGRNQTLYNYILRLQGAGLSKVNIKETIKIINAYVLKEPLSEAEIEVILRDEAFLKETFYIKNKLQYEKLAKYLIDNENIIKIGDLLHIYDNGYYSSDPIKIEKILLKYIKNSTKQPRSEVIRYLELLCKNKKATDVKYISFENGIYDLETKEILEFDPKYIIKNKIPHNYDPNAYHELMDKTLNKIACNDRKLRLLIEEMIGYTFLRRNEMGKSFILTGNGKNGKSTLLDLLNEVLGEDNISSVALDELKDKFKTFQLEGKLANIGDDISNKYIEDNSTFKKLVTGEKVNVERKGKDPFDFKNYSKLIFSANELPRINDLSDGLKRRILFIPFNAVFDKRDKDFDPFIKDKLTLDEALEYLIKLGMNGLYRILNNNEFTSSKSSDAVWKEYEEINNPVVAFISDKDIENQPVDDVYRQYTLWCVESGLKPLSKIAFSREVNKHGFNADTRIRIDKKQYRIFKSVTE